MDRLEYLLGHVDSPDPGCEDLNDHCSDRHIDAKIEGVVERSAVYVGSSSVVDRRIASSATLLIPLCRALSNFPTAMVGVSPVLFRQIIDMVDENFYLTESLRSHHHSLVGTCHSCGQHVRFRLQHLDHRSHQVQTGVVRHYRP